jgi:acyl-CoA thioester hydrolase
MPEYSYETDLAVRVRDIDFMGHVNNAVFATYLEEARKDYFSEVLDVPLSDIRAVLAHVEIDYRNRITIDDDDVRVAVRVPEIGESSIPMEYEIRADGEVMATGETVQVAVDQSGETRPITDSVRSSITEYEGLE